MPRSDNEVESKFRCFSYSTTILNEQFKIDVFRSRYSLFLWIGYKNSPTFDDLSLSIQNSHNRETLKTKILGTSEESINLALRLCKKLEKQVYVSLNVTTDVGLSAVPLLEKIIHQLIKDHPDRF